MVSMVNAEAGSLPPFKKNRSNPIYPRADSNMRYFNNIANGRHRKKLIHSLVVQEEGTIEGHEQLKSYITKYYKVLFGAIRSNIAMDKS
jgi:hypothetical protein